MEKKGSEKNRHVVPWLNKAELDQVRDYLYSMDSSLQGFALDRISAWRTRCADSFPVEVDCTADLVRCQMRDLSGQLTGDDLILMYRTALVRFVNRITEPQKGRWARPLKRLAGNLNIPEWVVDLRNEIMHGELPSLKCCQRGCKVALEWLQQEFWSRQLGGAPDERWDLQSHGEDEDVKRQEDELVARQKEDAATGSSIPGASAPARPAEGHR
ncbi:RISC-loading complex subunit TARBP2 [Sarotherodon galilaeus]